MKQPDAIVIGAGVVGSACALGLAKAGLKVVVLDRGPVSGGTTGAGEGNILVSDKEPGPELTLAIRSRNAWFEIADEIGAGFELEAKGGIVVARTQVGATALSHLAKRQQRAGVQAHELDRSALHQLEPYLDPSIDFGFHYPADAQCQPMLSAAQMLKALRSMGGEVITGAAVRAIHTKDSAISQVVTEKEKYSTEIVINATGTWAGEIAQMAGSYLPIAPRRGFILVSAPAPNLIRHKVYDADYVANVASDSTDLQSSAVVEGTKSGTILIGASRERVGFKSDFDISILRILARQAISLFPILASVQLMRAYRGFRPFAPDHLPVIGEDGKIKGLWHAAGHEGAGIGLAPATAEIIVGQVLAREVFMDASPFSPRRFIQESAP